MRLFVSVNPTLDFAKSVVDIQKYVKGSSFSGRFPPQENLHITCAFIGETDREDKAKAALSKVSFSGFEVKTGNIGHFGQLYYLGIDSDGELERLTALIRSKLTEYGVDYDKKPFKPHITLGREIVGFDGNLNIDMFRFNATGISLMKSEQLRGKRVYTELYKKKFI